MTITGGSALPKEDIERMMREAEEYAEEDHRRREAAESRNQAESLVYQTEKFLADNSDKLEGEQTAPVKAEVESAIAELKKQLEGNDTAGIKSATEKLATTSQSLGAAMYASAAPSESPTGDAGDGSGTSTSSTGESTGGDEDVVEAEIVDEDKGDK